MKSIIKEQNIYLAEYVALNGDVVGYKSLLYNKKNTPIYSDTLGVLEDELSNFNECIIKVDDMKALATELVSSRIDIDLNSCISAIIELKEVSTLEDKPYTVIVEGETTSGDKVYYTFDGMARLNDLKDKIIVTGNVKPLQLN